MNERILGIVGSYRKGGVIDSMVIEALAAAREHGAETEIVYLIDKHIEFCTNCRTCTQQPASSWPWRFAAWQVDRGSRPIAAKPRATNGFRSGNRLSS